MKKLREKMQQINLLRVYKSDLNALTYESPITQNVTFGIKNIPGAVQDDVRLLNQ